MPPARAPQSSFETPNGAHGVGSTLLKRHKVLPHPRPEPAPEFYPSPPRPTKKPQVLSIDTGVSSTPGSDTSSPRTLKHTSRRIGALPPTPPTHSRQSSGGYPAVPSAPRYDVKLLANPAEISSIPSTPTNQRSPPTPDVTPPRGMPLAFRPPMRPAAHERYPSSTTRTDSFKTAREQQSSSGDEDEDVSTVRPLFSSARASEMTIVPQLPEKSSKRKEIGLGLGLESEGTTTPRQRTKSPQDEFVVFDGEWASTPGEVSEVEREWDDNLMRNVTVRKRQRRGSLNMTADGAADEVVEKDIVSPTNATRVVRGLPLQQRIVKHRLERNSADRTSTEKFARDISWPSAVADPESPTTPDAKRFSTLSGRSGLSTVVVDAMVVDAAPSRRKTLRHTKKQLGLRDFGSDQSTLSSAPNSVASSEPPRLLHHKKAEIPQRRHQSLASNTTTSTNSSLAKSRRQVIKDGGIPVVIIPDRKSSSKSSNTPSLRSTSSQKAKRSMSLNSAPLSQSAKFNDLEYFNSPSHHKRTLSESAGSSSTDQRTIDFPPQIPTRRSSLSAPTSRNVSRAGSLTAESLKAHNMQQQTQKQQIDQALQKAAAEPTQKAEPPQSLPHSSPGLTRVSIKSNFDHNGDPFFGNRLSAQATPFSQSSYDTAGTAAEVSEAMVVSLYPHQNKSLLVVQHENSSPVETSSKSLQALEIPRSQPTMAQPTMAINNQPTTGPVTPPQPAHPMDKVDSPLRNPRAPPEPPAIKFIPPTPAGLTSGQEEERQLGYDPNDERPATSDSKPKRGLSLVRKALGNRRFSESGASGAGLLRRAFSHSGKKSSVDESTQTAKGEANPNTLYPTVDDRPPDGTKLHPFWRPAHFWDDLEGHDDEDSGDDEFGHVYPIVDNRPAPPKRGISGTLKRTFAILPIQDDNRYEREPHRADRRTVHRTASGNMRVVKQRSNSSMRRGASSPPTSRYRAPSKGEFGYGFQDRNGGKRGGGFNIPGLGVKVEYVGWGAMRRRLSERKREQRSEKLRGNISSPRGVQNGTDDVLRQHNRA